jgi:hypothetical protein
MRPREMVGRVNVEHWLSVVGPLLIPLIGQWLETRGMRRELIGLRRELRAMEADHLTRLVELEVRITKVESALSQVVAA